MNDAKLLLATAIKQYAPNNILQDCEVGNTCTQDRKLFKSWLIRGMRDLHMATNDNAVKETIMKVIQTSLNAMAPTCDSDYNCDSCWVCDGASRNYGVHNEVTAIVLVDAYIAIAYPNLAVKTTIPQPKPSTGNTRAEGYTNSLPLSLLLAGLALPF